MIRLYTNRYHHRERCVLTHVGLGRRTGGDDGVFLSLVFLFVISRPLCNVDNMNNTFLTPLRLHTLPFFFSLITNLTIV